MNTYQEDPEKMKRPFLRDFLTWCICSLIALFIFLGLMMFKDLIDRGREGCLIDLANSSRAYRECRPSGETAEKGDITLRCVFQSPGDKRDGTFIDLDVSLEDCGVHKIFARYVGQCRKTLSKIGRRIRRVIPPWTGK